jgi:hypothetical protein
MGRVSLSRVYANVRRHTAQPAARSISCAIRSNVNDLVAPPNFAGTSARREPMNCGHARTLIRMSPLMHLVSDLNETGGIKHGDAAKRKSCSQTRSIRISCRHRYLRNALKIVAAETVTRSFYNHSQTRAAMTWREARRIPPAHMARAASQTAD